MENINILENTEQEYAWGSETAIPELLGRKPVAGRPVAELWMGAHPKAPSVIVSNGTRTALPDLIEKYPERILGLPGSRFNNELPYLFKILAAASPLSVQAHPDKSRAKVGFDRENELGIPIDSPVRNYRDRNHKPECICALTDFWALNGFRDISGILELLGMIYPKGLEKEIQDLRNTDEPMRLRTFFASLLTLDKKRKEAVIAESIRKARQLQDMDDAFRWMTGIHEKYHDDIGIFSPIFLNLMRLKPGEAMFLRAGELHSYLDGLGLELMANSDNVLRGGLTPKHVDVDELLKTVNFNERKITRLLPVKISEFESVYDSYTDEFRLSVIRVKDNEADFYNESAEILLCTEGTALISEQGSQNPVQVCRGNSVIVFAAARQYLVKGDAVFYKASVKKSA